MRTYLAAHEAFVAWLDGLQGIPAAAEVDLRLRSLALCATDRGMGPMHWTFVVDGLVVYVNRKYPGNNLLSSYVARGFDLSMRWQDVEAGAIGPIVDVSAIRLVR